MGGGGLRLRKGKIGNGGRLMGKGKRERDGKS